MADNPNKKGLDRKFVSQQPHEQRYQAMKKKKSSENSKSTGRSAGKTSK
jgi:hypothetical protein